VRRSGSSAPTARASRPSSGSSRAFSSRRPGHSDPRARRPLLGLGVGFHQELTGRENIYLGAALFGFTTREIRALESSIIEFAELGQSSTCRSRTTRRGCRSGWDSPSLLEVTPDILRIDEVLAAGDEHFRRKCLRRLNRGRRMGCTYLVASHNLEYHPEPMRSCGPDRQRPHSGAGSGEGGCAIL
jgi:ABC-type multidrug transport system ATPase subunit